MTVNSSSNAGLVPSAFSACPSELISSLSPMHHYPGGSPRSFGLRPQDDKNIHEPQGRISWLILFFIQGLFAVFGTVFPEHAEGDIVFTVAFPLPILEVTAFMGNHDRCPPGDPTDHSAIFLPIDQKADLVSDRNPVFFPADLGGYGELVAAVGVAKYIEGKGLKAGTAAAALLKAVQLD